MLVEGEEEDEEEEETYLETDKMAQAFQIIQKLF